jgi:DNA topoisomerase-1
VETGVFDRRLARVVARCQDLPGQELFQYLDEHGLPRPIGSADVNAYLREAARQPISAKDFRTWGGTLIAFRTLHTATADGASGAESATGAALPARAALRESFELVSKALGNTARVSRASYVAPSVVEAFSEGSLGPAAARPEPRKPRRGNRREELELIRLLEARIPGRRSAR